MKSILVTGGCGFIGSHFIKLILRTRQQYRLVNVDLLTYAGNPENLSMEDRTADPLAYRFVHGDIADARLILELLERESIDAVVNFAAETHVDRSLIDSAPFVRTNIEGTRILLDAATKRGVEKYLQVSTDEVYGALRPSDPTFTEESPLKPNSPYAASKAAGDLLVRAYHSTYSLPAVITRCGNNYGPYQFPEKFLPLFITHAMDDQPLPLYGDGQQIRDWIHVEDHSRALLDILERGSAGGIYNIGAGNERTNLSMARTILRVLNKPESLIDYVRDRAGHDRRYGINSQKLRLEMGWEPMIGLEEGLRATIEWYCAERIWWQRVQSGEYKKSYNNIYAGRL